MPLPLFTLVRQRDSHPAVEDVAGEVRRQWEQSGVLKKLPAKARVAVAVGSRGIRNLETIVRTTLEVLRQAGAEPFIVAAMGSHGGATAQGQRELLAEYGITEDNLGVPVKTDMDSVPIGVNRWNEPVYWDKNALAADAVLTISRIKPHTDFRGRIESGIVKMITIGLGKREGAAQHHRWGVRGLRDMIPESAQVIVAKTPFLAGLAILENAKEETALLKVVPKESLFDEEPHLLEQARQMMGRIPFDQLDVLVIGEIGKNYSGAGIDPNVVGRLLVEGEPEFDRPRITRICALDVSPESHGNAVGIGIADLTTDRLIRKIDPIPFRMNTLTSCFLWRAKIPISFPTDRECIEAGLQTCWQPVEDERRVAIIPTPWKSSIYGFRKR